MCKQYKSNSGQFAGEKEKSDFLSLVSPWFSFINVLTTTVYKLFSPLCDFIKFNYMLQI